jgi:hypothetical protein
MTQSEIAGLVLMSSTSRGGCGAAPELASSG